LVNHQVLPKLNPKLIKYYLVLLDKNHLMVSMRGIFLTVKRMDSGHIRGHLVQVREINMRVTGKMTKNMEKEYLFALITIGTKESSRMTLRVVKEYIIMSMVISILGIGKITKRMVKEH